jgi:choline dehydrogenase-like flavoprotein
MNLSANVVVVCASPIESVRLLLNSKSNRHPNGLANSSGVLGHYFMDQVPSLIFGFDPHSEGAELDDSAPPDPFYGVTGGVYIPRWENLDSVTNRNYVRGFGYQGTIGRLYVRKGVKAKFAIMGFGELLPNYHNAITLDPKKKDRWDMPLPHIRCWIGDNERTLLQAQTDEIKDMVESAGLEVEWTGSPLGLKEYGKGAFKGSMTMGASIHESGGARMGADPTKSVLNAYNQSWDVKNLFVTDASSFCTSGTCGTTLTIMALTIRACEYIAYEYRAGAL